MWRLRRDMVSAFGTAARCAVPISRGWLSRARARYALGRGFGARRDIATAAAALSKSSDKGLTPPAAGPGTESQAIEDHKLDRQTNIKNARPFSDFLTDGFRRQHDYLRISITERCNLRCLYCMPEEGIDLSPSRNILTTPEIVLLANVFVSQGVNKIRLTGGEPTVRRDILPLMQQLGDLRRIGLKELCLTTNGLALHRKLDTMAEAGLTGVNLSLDTLDPLQFRLMTRRDGFPAVRRSMDRIMAMNKAGAGIRLKINCVVMRGLNDNEINDFVALTQDYNLEVRFIEYMPFDGNRWSTGKMVSFNEMLERIGGKYPTLRRTVPDGHHNGPNDTSKTYEVPGFAGRVGFITSMTNSFCGGCNRLRITSDGSLKVCLFGNAEVSLRDVLRKANGGEPIDEASYAEMVRIAREAASVSTGANRDIPIDIPIDNLLPNASELLEIIGMAVKRKKERHAGIGELEHMKNRPMILIDENIRPKLPHISRGSGLVRDWGRNTMGGLAGHFSPPGLSSAPWQARAYSTRGSHDSHGIADSEPKAAASPESPESPEAPESSESSEEPRLTHVSASGTAHMVSVAEKAVTSRVAAASCTVRFSSPVAAALVRANDMAKGDVLGVARIAGIMAAKRTADLIPLCHPLALSHVAVDLEISDPDISTASTSTPISTSTSDDNGYISIRASVRCEGKTGVEMEALTAASVAALTVFDMCKAVDKGMRIDGLRVVYKDGGKSGRWQEK